MYNDMVFKKYLIIYKINLEINKIIITDQCMDSWI